MRAGGVPPCVPIAPSFFHLTVAHHSHQNSFTLVNFDTNITLGGVLFFCTANTMAASATVLPPYWSEPFDGHTVVYQSISFHPLVQKFSFEELRLAHYEHHREKLKPYLSDTSKLMRTQQRSTLRMTPPFMSIRASAHETDKYVFGEGTYERCS